MINYANEEVHFEGCPACAYANHKFELPCGMAYENERFTLSQDWELPIQGFFVVSPKKCVEKFCDLSQDERNELFDIIDKTIKTLREHDICDRFNVVFEEKSNCHFHVWIMPRHQWMEALTKNIIGNISQIFDYAKANLKTEETFESIKHITKIVADSFCEK